MTCQIANLTSSSSATIAIQVLLDERFYLVSYLALYYVSNYTSMKVLCVLMQRVHTVLIHVNANFACFHDFSPFLQNMDQTFMLETTARAVIEDSFIDTSGSTLESSVSNLHVIQSDFLHV